jgi:hypothetical protein
VKDVGLLGESMETEKSISMRWRGEEIGGRYYLKAK